MENFSYYNIKFHHVTWTKILRLDIFAACSLQHNFSIFQCFSAVLLMKITLINFDISQCCYKEIYVRQFLKNKPLLTFSEVDLP